MRQSVVDCGSKPKSDRDQTLPKSPQSFLDFPACLRHALLFYILFPSIKSNTGMLRIFD